jgi:dephospho-CoA kinase
MGCTPGSLCHGAAVAVEVALGISGRIGSGKTSLAVVLAERLNCPRASFGDYVRAVATDRGLDGGVRQVLQEVGDDLIAAGWDAFCAAVLNSAGYCSGSVVVDGIRHADAAQTMQKLVAPTPWELVSVESEDSIRRSRLAARGVDEAGTTQADAHPNEGEVASVMASADLVVSSDSTAAEAADVVMEWLTTV